LGLFVQPPPIILKLLPGDVTRMRGKQQGMPLILGPRMGVDATVGGLVNVHPTIDVGAGITRVV